MESKTGTAPKTQDTAALANKARDAELLAEQARKDVAELSNDEIQQRIRMIEGNMRAMKVESQRLHHETSLVANLAKVDQLRHQGESDED